MKLPLHRQRPTQTEAAPKPPAPAIFVIFGITGDLAQRMLLPALYHLVKDDLLHEHTAIVGVSRHQLNIDDFLANIEDAVCQKDGSCDPEVLASFRKRLHLVRVDPVDADDYDALLVTLNDIEDTHGVCMNRLYYLAIPPQVYQPVIENLGKHRLNEGCQHHRAVSRLLVEKPFGYDLVSARELIRHTAQYFTEQQVFRIDHYLAKEAAQNLLVFRASNPLFTAAWDNQHVERIDLLFSETIGVEGRAGFYDNVGALRDVVQNHLMQLLVLTTMELPKSATNETAVHQAKRKLLKMIPPVDVRRFPIVRGQYDGYQDEVKNPGSTTETFVKLRLEIHDGRWRGVPVTLTAGKALDVKQTSVSVLFNDKHHTSHHNRLTFRISPNEGIDIRLTAKRPGFEEQTEHVTMDFSYRQAFGGSSHPDAYERVLIDAIRGDHALFASSSEVLESWRILQPILDSWSMASDSPQPYPRGTAGPQIT